MPQRFLARLGQIDISERLAPLAPRWATQLGFALLCIAVEVILRFLIGLVAPGAAPFALIFPATLAATLFAGWQSGLIVLAVSELLAWYFVVPAAGSFALTDPGDGARIIVVALAGAVVIVLADIFRRAVSAAARSLAAQIAERDLLLREIDHRIKNNFMMVSALVDIQRRSSDEPAVKEALGAVLARIESFARAHRRLYRDGSGRVSDVHMPSYVGDLCEALAQALTLHGAISLKWGADDVMMERDRAVTIGLLINELVTNAAKHAFEGRQSGNVSISFRRAEEGWRLVVADDGVGVAAARTSKTGLGQRLVEAFVRQANGTLATESDASGTRVTIDLKP
jgi:two-component sensor histidine kinase